MSHKNLKKKTNRKSNPGGHFVSFSQIYGVLRIMNFFKIYHLTSDFLADIKNICVKTLGAHGVKDMFIVSRLHVFQMSFHGNLRVHT